MSAFVIVAVIPSITWTTLTLDCSNERPEWPEQPGRATKMMHMEVLVDDLEAAVRLVLHSGGREAAHQPADRDRTRLRIMLDPAGHPFCLFVDGE